MDNYSLSDIAAVSDRNGNGFNNEGLWLFAILALMGGGFGFGNNWGNNNGGCSPVTEAGLCNANSFSELKGSVRNVLDQVYNTNANVSKGICDLGYATIGQFGNLEKQLAQCCCEILRANDATRFDMANFAAAINTNTTAGIQKILDKMCEDKQAAMAARIQQLELQAAMCGVVKYPTQAAYCTPCNPFCGC